ncbi:tetratricopeptide repeat protein [Trinickia dinghuensis]|uniref:Sel1 repeat family protein n=1 Tax=Trinickia dinghuensis TaxID=2291023 RepID=A0A3D8JPA2_9BURK|nr:tetratricopeptide repeat protein [Trinickia dinghuensis]RDU94535.1 sel1 repeat family protein [Trinickia dinghuensis]
MTKQSQDEWEQEPDLDGVRQALNLLKENSSEGERKLIDLAKKGSIYCMIRLGHYYWNKSVGAGDDDINRAEFWFSSACEAGSGMATFYLGRLYLKEGEYEKAHMTFEKGANLGYAPSIFNLGRMYRDGIGVNKNFDVAHMHFERAANLGHIYAKRALGRILLSGEFGFFSRFGGAKLVLCAAIEAVRELQRDHKSLRLQI